MVRQREGKPGAFKRLLTWEFLIVAYLAFFCLTLMGCSTHHSLTIGESTYTGSLSLGKYEHE